MKLESAGKSVTILKSLTGDRDKRRSISVTSLTKQSEIESAQFSSMLPPLFRTNSSPQQKTSAAFCEADSNELKEAGDQVTIHQGVIHPRRSFIGQKTVLFLIRKNW